jgi:hypothetical protein
MHIQHPQQLLLPHHIHIQHLPQQLLLPHHMHIQHLPPQQQQPLLQHLHHTPIQRLPRQQARLPVLLLPLLRLEAIGYVKEAVVLVVA